MLSEGGNRICSPELLAQIAEVIDSAVLISRYGTLGQFDHRIIYINPAFSKLLGYTNGEVLGRSPDFLCDPRTSSDKMLDFYSRCRHGGKFSFQLDSFRKQGGELKLSVDVTPVIDETQGTHYYILMLKNASAQAANVQPQSFEARFMQPPQAPAPRPEVYNESIYSTEAGYEQPTRSNFVPPQAPREEAPQAQKFDERYWLSPNNDLTPHNNTASAQAVLNGSIPTSVTTPQVEATSVPAELSSEESIAEYCKTQFLANMSHDLRTPLNAIIGFSEVIKDQLFGPIENPRYVSYANDIFRSGQELFTTISEIMELSEIEPSEELAEEERMNICDVIESVIDILSPKAFESDIKILKSLEARDMRLTGDRRKIKQAIAGVIGNAIRFSTSGSSIEIKTSMNERGDFKIAIYARTANITNSRGSLLGTVTKKIESEFPEISLARRFVEAHEGKFNIFNSATSGTEIAILLPGHRLSIEPEKKTLLKVIS